uniref:Uncharacterized protein n=1 Tax=Setaria italica TaxID=4555 RepID=K3XTH3_SETIT
MRAGNQTPCSCMQWAWLWLWGTRLAGASQARLLQEPNRPIVFSF